MKLFTNKKLLQKEIRKLNNISFVPTMGALHRGHESIIRKSVKDISRLTIAEKIEQIEKQKKNTDKKKK